MEFSITDNNAIERVLIDLDDAIERLRIQTQNKAVQELVNKP